ncbi:MAG: lipoyl synthase [Neptuniibacter sp.]
MNTKALIKQRGKDKVDRIPVKVIPTTDASKLKKPDWLRVRMGNSERVTEIQSLLRQHKMASVCEEASCPNLHECFSHGTATFMIMGDICTRRCPFCDVAHGRPDALNQSEPEELAELVNKLRLSYVVITSVDRDDLRDGGAGHFVACIEEIRKQTNNTKIECLVPDFRGRLDVALDGFASVVPDVLNHNLESVPRLYKQIRPGSDYQESLELLQRFKQMHPEVVTKSGIMLGLGETIEEVHQVMRDLRAAQVDMITIGQYLQPSDYHLPVDRYVTPEEFNQLQEFATELGFDNAACGPLVRSSYQADKQAKLKTDLKQEKGR